MAIENLILQDSGAAAADYSAKQYFGVYYSAAETLTLVAAQGAVGWPLEDDPESGEFGTLGLLGISKAEAGGTWAVGNPLCWNSSGALIVAVNDTDWVVGRAIMTATSGDVASFVITNEGYGSLQSMAADGRSKVHCLRCTFDPSANTGERTIAAHAVAETLPDNAMVVRAYYTVMTTFTSATDAATISIGIPTDDAAGIVAAIAISNGANPWDAGNAEGIQDGTAANFSEVCTAERAITFTVAVEALTAGKVILFLEYVIVD
jgi:hypothetical protein